MRLSDIHRYHTDRDFHDREVYKDHFEKKDSPYAVVAFGKVWKSFKTERAARLAADGFNRRVGRLVAFVEKN
jgi:hypothetical protein